MSISSSSSTSNNRIVGYRFRPTDEEIVKVYLRNKVSSRDSLVQIITLPEINNLYDLEPWQLPGLPWPPEIDPKCQTWYFFCRRNPNCKRVSRVTKLGFWSITGNPRMIRDEKTREDIGFKRTMTFYRKDPFSSKKRKENKTPWVIHEYHLTSNLPNENTYVLCKLKKKEYEMVDISSAEDQATVNLPDISSLEGQLGVHLQDISSPQGQSSVQLADISSPQGQRSVPLPDIFSPQDQLSVHWADISSPQGQLSVHLTDISSPQGERSVPLPGISCPQGNLPDISSPQGQFSVQWPDISSPQGQRNVPLPGISCPQGNLPDISSPQGQVSVSLPGIFCPQGPPGVCLTDMSSPEGQRSNHSADYQSQEIFDGIEADELQTPSTACNQEDDDILSLLLNFDESPVDSTAWNQQNVCFENEGSSLPFFGATSPISSVSPLKRSRVEDGELDTGAETEEVLTQHHWSEDAHAGSSAFQQLPTVEVSSASLPSLQHPVQDEFRENNPYFSSSANTLHLINQMAFEEQEYPIDMGIYESQYQLNYINLIQKESAPERNPTGLKLSAKMASGNKAGDVQEHVTAVHLPQDENVITESKMHWKMARKTGPRKRLKMHSGGSAGSDR